MASMKVSGLADRTLAELEETWWVEADPTHPDYGYAVELLAQDGAGTVAPLLTTTGTDWWMWSKDGKLAYSSAEHHGQAITHTDFGPEVPVRC